jgi:predicted AlkP superfamily phosphohydrolase/phosphomutase
MTGVQPGTHGVVDWESYDPGTQEKSLHNTARFAKHNMYHLLSAAGYRVGAVMQPITYPPFEVNGFLLSGFDGPGTSAPFANPRELEKTILEICPEHEMNFEVTRSWDAGEGGSDETFKTFVERLNRKNRLLTDLTLGLHAREPVEVLFVYFHASDEILHRAWRWCDPETAGENPLRRDLCTGFFRELDAACKRIADAFGADNAFTLVLSDHGQRPDRVRVRMNSVLMDLGLLVPAGGGALLKDGYRRLRRVTSGQKKTPGFGVPVDWDRTRAFMPFQACTGFIYVNLKSRQPFGSVEPSDYENVRDEVIEKLRAWRHPETGDDYFEEVGATDGLFRNKERYGLPDIYVQPRPGVEFVRRAKRGEMAYPTKRPYAGLHDPDGIYLLAGHGVVKRENQDAQIVDLAPTVLSALGLAVPDYMEGRPLLSCLKEAPEVKTYPLAWEAEAASESAYTEEQEAEVEERLKDLGYLD